MKRLTLLLAYFNLDDARFARRSNGGDLRLGFSGTKTDPVIAEVLVKPRPNGRGRKNGTLHGEER